MLHNNSKSDAMKNLFKIFKVVLGLSIPFSMVAQSTFPNLSQNSLPISLVTNNIPIEQTEPQRTIINSDENSITINYKFNGYQIANRQEANQSYQYIQIKNFSKMGEVGKPALPAHNDMIALPSESYSIQIIEAPYKEISGFNIFPALEAASDEAGTSEPTFIIDENTYSSNSFFPSEIVKVEVIQKIRGVNMGIFQVRPIQFNPVTHKIRVYQYIKYKIIFNGQNQEFQNLKNNNSDNYLKNLNHGILNSNLLPLKRNLSAKSSNSVCNIIIITTNNYMAAADTLAKWKRQLGFSVLIVSKASWTFSQVKDTVYSLYQSWNPHPDYLTIIGDHADVPADSIPYGTTYYLSDLYYAYMDGAADYFPDMAFGRISVNSASQALTVIQKIVNYERNPVNDQSFFSNIATASYFQDGATLGSSFDGYADRRYLHTAEEIRSYLVTKNYSVNRIYYAFSNRNPTHYNNGYYSMGEAVSSDILKSNGFQWNGSAADINSNINAGKFLFIHRDHGYYDGYGWEHPYYLNQEANTQVSDGNHINQLTNGNKLPVLLSINCNTGEFRMPECFAENFLRKADGGAVGVIAPTYTTYSGYNDAIADGLIDAIWSNPGLVPAFGSGGISNPTVNVHSDIFSMGDVMVQGLLRMPQTWASTTKYKMQYEIYMYFGDPAMKIWTANPTTISVANIDTIIRFDSSIVINSSNCPDGIATLMINDSLVSSATLVNGSGTLNYSISGDAQAILTISAHNFRPFIKSIHLNNIIKSVAPSSQAKNVRFLADGGKSASIYVEWDKGDGDFDLVKISEDGNFTAPTNGVEYSANTVYSGAGEQVVFAAAGTSVTVSNLTSGQVYWFRVYEYNNDGIYTLYQTITESNNPNTPDGGGVLPVEISTFKAVVIDGKIDVQWVTVSEINNDKFLIQRSTNRYHFDEIGQVNGNGNSNVPIEYNFIDKNPVNGISYYRLAQLDFDGKIKYSKIADAHFDESSNNKILSKIIQNSQEIELSISQIIERTLISLIDVTGKVIYKSEINPSNENSKIKIPITNISKGIYLIALQSENKREVTKFIINN